MTAKEKAGSLGKKAAQAKKEYFKALENGKEDWEVELKAWHTAEKVYATAATEAIFAGEMTMDEALA